MEHVPVIYMEKRIQNAGNRKIIQNGLAFIIINLVDSAKAYFGLHGRNYEVSNVSLFWLYKGGLWTSGMKFKERVYAVAFWPRTLFL